MNFGLEISLKKMKVMVFNKVGKVLKGLNFYLNGKLLEVTDEYQYLGIKFKPPGSMSLASDILSVKANRACFSISEFLYRDKRVQVKRAFQLFDSIVTPVALYACEFWLTYVIPKSVSQVKKNHLLIGKTLNVKPATRKYAECCCLSTVNIAA